MESIFFTDLQFLILIIGTTSFLVTYILVPIIKGFGERYNINDIPNNRKLHTRAIVRLGGVPIFVGFFVVFYQLYLQEI